MRGRRAAAQAWWAARRLAQLATPRGLGELRRRRRIARVFDGGFYLARNPDVAAAGMDPLDHYLTHGWRERRDPSPLFDADWYLATYRDVAVADVEPLWHYLSHGAAEGRQPAPGFDSRALQRAHRVAEREGLTPLELALRQGKQAEVDAGPRIAAVFDPVHYLATNPDIAEAGVYPLAHYAEFGWREWRNPSPFFDVLYYLETYPDVRQAGVEPLRHYLEHGAAEGRNPSTLFDTMWYRRQYPECTDGVGTPLEHFLLHGAHRGHRTRPKEGLRQARREGWQPTTALLRTAVETLRPPLGAEPDLAAWAPRLEDLPARLTATPRRDAGWRSLHRSLGSPPRRLILVARLDTAAVARLLQLAAPPLAIEDPVRPLLVLATDAPGLPALGAMPPGLEWRSLFEFGLETLDDRLAATLALILATQPEAILVAGSEVGAMLLARHGAALAALAALHAATLPSREEDPVVARAPAAVPHLAALHTGDAALVSWLVDRYRLPATTMPTVAVVPELADPSLTAVPLRPWLGKAPGSKVMPASLRAEA